MAASQQITTYRDIDWQQLWEQSRAQRSWRSKDAAGWDKKAPAFASRMRDSAYVERFLQHLDLDPSLSVLDVGCGPGTLSVPLAGKVARVTAIDYSAKMLELLREQADQAGLGNIRTVLCAWEDDWAQHDIATYDIVIASRSLNIRNLTGGLKKLSAHAAGPIYVADRIDPSPMDADAFKAVGRPFESGPDYIYTVNILYGLGIHPRIELIEMDREQRFDSLEHALNAYTWMFKELQPDEERLLRSYVEKQVIASGPDYIIVKRDPPQRWALLSWNHTPNS